ncbi:MAG: ABC transporter substrate-binding protein [Aggregatilineales bacterium]
MKSRSILFFLSLSLMVLVSGIVSAQDTTYSEAPMLAELVAAGELPPVEERLPEQPFVIDGEAIGEYGGTWRRVFPENGAFSTLITSFAFEPLVQFSLDLSTVVPNVAERWEVNEDATEYTFYIRPGIRWSDGEFFTTDDVLFQWEMSLNEEWNPSGNRPFRASDIVIIDDYTFTYVFDQPNGIFLSQLAHPDGNMVTQTPRHYLEQFWPDSNPDALQMAADAGFDQWTEWYEQLSSIYFLGFWNPDRPTLGAWIGTSEIDGASTRYEFTRNPYYFKVDSTGQQYPYIDNIDVAVLSDMESMVLRAAAGEVDMQWQFIGQGTANRSFFFENAEAGGYAVEDTLPVFANTGNVFINQTHPDPVKREVFGNLNFRVALSHAIDRQAIIDTLYFGLTTPAQVGPLPGTALHNPQLSFQYTEYNVDLANELLDEILADRDGEGFRLGPDGEPFTITFLTVADVRDYTDQAQLIAGYWNAVGVRTEVREVDRVTRDDIAYNNQHDVTSWHSPAGVRVYENPKDYFPWENNRECLFGVGWRDWYTIGADAENAVEPPPSVMRQLELYEEFKATADLARQQEIFEEILQIAADNFYSIGISTPLPDLQIVSNRMQNVPTIAMNFSYGLEGLGNPFTYFLNS